MSENIPESIPRSADPRSQRPIKRARGPASALSAQSSALEHLFAQPDKQVYIPTSATKLARTAADMAPPPEIVANVQGSSAGAGSGEFHVYKASRRREFERIRLMEVEAIKEDADAEWAAKQEERKSKDDAGRSKNIKRREKAKARKKDGKGPGDGGGEGVTADGPQLIGKPTVRKGLAPTLYRRNGNENDDDHEEQADAVQDEQGLVIHDDD